MTSRRRSRRASELEDDESGHSADGSRATRSPEVCPRTRLKQQTRPEKRRRQVASVVSEDEVDEGIEITEIGSEDSGDESEVEATQRQRAQIQQRVRDRRSGDSVCSRSFR